jgi:DNA invertase Pin-like site-specific DNA recombinase
MLIGYARVSTQDQNPDLQIDDLEKAGCEKIFTDKASGSKEDRPQLIEIFNHLRKEDTLVVWKLDRLGRSLNHLIQLINKLKDRSVYFKSLKESLDTSTTAGTLIFHIFGALAEFEREIIRERTMAGLASARARGRVGGRPRKLNQEKIDRAISLWKKNENPINEICKMLDISRSTFYRYLKKE